VNDKHCGTCKFWHALPVPRGAVAVGPERMGECRQQLHVNSILTQAPNGQPVIVNQAGFAQTHAGFPACGQHEPLLEVGIAVDG
jgi:hypothetical protein